MLRVLRHRDFALLWLGQAVSLVGDGIYLVSIAWLVYDISNTPSALGIVGLAWTLPQVAALLFAGVLTDRFERRRLLVLADLLRVVAVGGIAALALTDSAALWSVVVLVVVYGFGEALFQPAFTAIVPSVVPQEQLLQASALRELVEPVGMRFAGPALGGLLIAVSGVGTAFVVDASTFALSALAVSLITRRPAPAVEKRSVGHDLRAGFAFVRERRWLWVTLVSAALTLLAAYGPLEVLLPYLIRNDLGGDAATYGLVLSAGGLGSIGAALLLSRTGAPRRHMTFMYVAWAFGTLVQALFAIAGSAWQMCIVAFVGFGLATAGMVVWNTLMQTLVPSDMLGRVSSFDWFVSTGLVPLSFALTGPVAALVGEKETLAGACILGFIACGLLFVPGVRDAERHVLPGGTRSAPAEA